MAVNVVHIHVGWCNLSHRAGGEGGEGGIQDRANHHEQDNRHESFRARGGRSRGHEQGDWEPRQSGCPTADRASRREAVR